MTQYSNALNDSVEILESNAVKSAQVHEEKNKEEGKNEKSLIQKLEEKNHNLMKENGSLLSQLKSFQMNINSVL